MKKAITIFLCLMMILLAACGSAPQQAETQETAESAKAEPRIEAPSEEQSTDEAEPVDEEEAEAIEEETESAGEEAASEGEEPAAEAAGNMTEESASELSLPENMASTFYFSSGAGGWGTELLLEPDGSFSGTFHDSDMGDIGEGYPNGTRYLCVFRGHFTVLEHPDESSWILKMDRLEQDQTKGESWIEDGVRYVGADPYGLDGGVDYVLYAPERPVDSLSDELKIWWPGRWNPDGVPETLACWCIEGVDMEYGFFAYD